MPLSFWGLNVKPMGSNSSPYLILVNWAQYPYSLQKFQAGFKCAGKKNKNKNSK